MVLPNASMGSARVKCANSESNPTIILLITRSARHINRQTARGRNSNSLLTLFDSLVPFLQLFPDLLQVGFQEGWRQLRSIVATGLTRVVFFSW